MFTLLLEYHGLSRQGAHILALCGLVIGPRTANGTKKRKLAIYDEEESIVDT